jgi:hypothetical protein
MKRFVYPLVAGLAILTMPVVGACQKADEQKPAAQKAEAAHEFTQAEITASVPALRDLHGVVYPLWHDAYPDKNLAMIKELLPRMDTLTAKLDAAALPGILREKQAAWDEKKASLKSTLQQLHAAAAADDGDEMLKQVEAFHAYYEQLVRTIRPLVKELDAYHQELYKLFHYYAPDYDLEKIRAVAAAMAEKLPALKAAELPKRLAERQADFKAAVEALDAATLELVETAKGNAKEKILAAVDKVHTAYQNTEHIFD